MYSIDAHRLTFPNPEDELAFIEEEVEEAPKYIAKVPNNIGVFFVESLRLLGFRSFLNHPSEEILEALKSARDLGVGLFMRGSATPDETVRFALGDVSIEVPGGTSEYNTASRWISAFGVGLILRDQEALDMLCRYNPIDFKGSNDQYHIALATALMAMHNDSEETDAAFEAALERGLGARDFSEWRRRLGAPLVRLARAVFHHEAEEFDDQVVEALEGYKAMHSRKSESSRAEAYIPVAHLGLCAMAMDRGMHLEVTSPYLPEWLLSYQPH